MIVLDAMKMHKTEREVKCPNGGFDSIRILVKEDNMGFTVTRTTIHPTADWQRWHYKNHLEACYCIAGKGKLKDSTGVEYDIKPGILYALDKHDEHYFKTDERVILICVFNPPLVGHELHRGDGSYEVCAETAQDRMQRIVSENPGIGRDKLARLADVPQSTARDFLKKAKNPN